MKVALFIEYHFHKSYFNCSGNWFGNYMITVDTTVLGGSNRSPLRSCNCCNYKIGSTRETIEVTKQITLFAI